MKYLGIPIGIGQNCDMIVATGHKGATYFKITGKSLFFNYQDVCLQRAQTSEEIMSVVSLLAMY